MILRFEAVMIVLGLTLAAVAAHGATASASLANGRTVVLSADTIDGIGGNWSKIVLSGDANIKLFDKTKSSMLHASSGKIVVSFGSTGDAQPSGRPSIKTADLTGSCRVIYEAPDPSSGKMVKTTATSTSAIYDGATESLSLKGGVKIITENPTVFEGPAEMTGDEAVIRLSPNLGPDEVRFRISSSTGVSTVTATPKTTRETKSTK